MMSLFRWKSRLSSSEGVLPPPLEEDDVNDVMLQILTDLDHCGESLTSRVTEFSSTINSALGAFPSPPNTR